MAFLIKNNVLFCFSIPLYHFSVFKAISRIMADKVYTSAEFKRERDNFHVSFDSNFLPQGALCAAYGWTDRRRDNYYYKNTFKFMYEHNLCQ